MKTHICLVSEQLLANVIPALMDRPGKVILVTSAAMSQRGLDARLHQVLTQHGLNTEIEKNSPDVSLHDIRRYADALVERLKGKMPEAVITLNATGGNKLMMLGFVEVFRRHGLRIIYADTAHGRIERIDTDETIAMTDVLDVPGYLAVQGMRFDRADSDDPGRREAIARRSKISRFMGKRVRKLQNGIKILNGMLADAIEKDADQKEKLVRNEFALKYGAWGAFDELLSLCSQHGLIEWQKNEKEMRITDVDVVRYLTGGWLEEYAWLCANDAKPFDVRMGVHRGGQQDEELNEFDLLLVQVNQMLFVECKTANYQKQISQANQAAYKVESLSRQARGLFGQTWLLSAIDPPQELVNRAQELRIRVIGPQDLPRLSTHIAEWMACLTGQKVH